MPQFSRRTIIAAVDTIAGWSHADINRFALEHALEETGAVDGSSRQGRANTLMRFLLRNPDWPDQDGGNLTDTIVRDLVRRAAAGAPQVDEFEKKSPDLARALKRDGFDITNGDIRLALPESLNLPAADDEVHRLLEDMGLKTPLGHLEQAIKNHTDGLWAASNSQLRTYMDSLYDEMAAKLAAVANLPPVGNARRNWLASLSPPFLDPALNEWDSQGKGFLEGFYRRLHPAGSHPGLSDEDDCTFRLHLVLLVSRLLLRRLRARI